jgi:anti-sigma-K factor RskA
MNHPKVHPDLAAFALGGLEPEEAAEIRRHIASCAGCQGELEELEKVNSLLDAAPPPAAPPAYLKGEILSRVRSERLSPSSEAGAAEPSSSPEEQGRSLKASLFDRFKSLRIVLPTVAAVLVAAIALGVSFGSLREGPPVATIQLTPTPQEAAVLDGYWGVAEIRPQPSGNQQVELKLNNFEGPKPGSYYELWFVSGEKRISAGSFTSVGRGETRVLLNAAPEAGNYRTIVITEEHVGKGPAPGREVALEGDIP